MTYLAFFWLALAIVATSWPSKGWPSTGWLAVGWRKAGRYSARQWVIGTSALLALGFAAVAGLLSNIALCIALVTWGLALALQPARRRFWRAAPPKLRVLTWGALALSCLTLALHLPPGIANPLLVDQVRLSADSLPYTLYANFDKGWAGFCLLLALLPRQRQQAQPAIQPATATSGQASRWLLSSTDWLLVLLTIGLSLGLAWLFGLIRFDAKLPDFLLLFMFCNLLLTCVAEEAFFRGVLQQGLRSFCVRRGYHVGWAVLVAATCFGLAHLAGGWAYALVATVAGLGYGWLYQQTGRLQAAILLHFALNLTHLLAFSYPMLNAARISD